MDSQRRRRPPRPESSPPAARRVECVDAARGFAVAMMIAYHFCFDLTYYRWASWRMLEDASWIAWRSTIVACFVFLVGVSLALRDARDGAAGSTAWLDRDFLRRWLQIAGAALLVTAGSAVLFPSTFIYFGVLHFVAVALWACRRAPRLGGGALALGGLALALGVAASDPAFDSRLVNWIGFASEKPLTEDYVPLFPWIGVVLVGCGAGALWLRRDLRLAPPIEAAWNAIPGSLRRLLAGAGRWSLTIYLVHQPLLIGAMGAVRRFA